MTPLPRTSEANEVLYIIAPDSVDCSHDQLTCQTFQNFINSHHSELEENITLIFMKGNHTLSTNTLIVPLTFQFPSQSRQNFIFTKSLIIKAATTEAIIHNADILFRGTCKLQIENLTLINGYFHIHMAKETMRRTCTNDRTQLSLVSVTAINYTLAIEYASTAKLEDCKFIGGVSPLSIRKSTARLFGYLLFFNNQNSALVSYSSDITLSGNVYFVNNSGIRGGAMALYSSPVHLTNGLNIFFINNSAQQTGGAVHIEPDMTRSSCPECFYEASPDNDIPLYYNPETLAQDDIALYYYENSAQFGGDNIYGTSLELCKYKKVEHHYLSNESISSVSSDPRQVCLCDSNGLPRCENELQIPVSKSVHPGETFNIPAIIVGGDYGTTIGIVHISFTSDEFLSVPDLKSSHQYSQWVGNISMCTHLEYTIFTKEIGENFTMHFTVHYNSKQGQSSTTSIDTAGVQCNALKHGYYSSTPTHININVLPCPMGLTLLEDPSACDCDPTLTRGSVECSIINETGYFKWNSTLWINITDTGFIYAKYCPLHYCDPAGRLIDLEKEPFVQCAFNRAGRLCGGCREGHSLALGSSHCIHCPNNNGLSLIIFFAAAGFLLVFFISTLNLTLTQGLLGGLIFYANIVWTYQSVLFPKERNINNIAIVFLKTFIAWLNLDFGIEICFVRGLTSYVKTWLQFAFPFYLWAIVGLMVLTARYSRKLTRLYGNRVVPVLTTLFLFSYMKLLRTVTSIYIFSDLIQHPEMSKTIVWSVDGRVDYFGLPHALLLAAALIVQIFLWLPYTLTLLLHQKLQKMSHLRIFKWIMSLKPFFDVHFAPFKPAHRYWFGVLLLARGILYSYYHSRTRYREISRVHCRVLLRVRSTSNNTKAMNE